MSQGRPASPSLGACDWQDPRNTNLITSHCGSFSPTRQTWPRKCSLSLSNHLPPWSQSQDSVQTSPLFLWPCYDRKPEGPPPWRRDYLSCSELLGLRAPCRWQTFHPHSVLLLMTRPYLGDSVPLFNYPELKGLISFILDPAPGQGEVGLWMRQKAGVALVVLTGLVLLASLQLVSKYGSCRSE